MNENTPVASKLQRDAHWILTLVISILYLVPLNDKVAKSSLDWAEAHKAWDERHRIRVIALAAAALLLSTRLSRLTSDQNALDPSPHFFYSTTARR